MILRDSRYKGTTTLNDILTLAAQSLGEDPDWRRGEFMDLVRAAQKLE